MASSAAKPLDVILVHNDGAASSRSTSAAPAPDISVGDLPFDEMKTFNFLCMPVRKFNIRLKSCQKASRNVGKSFVWDYFGDLCCNGILCDPRRYYCNLCLEKAKQDARINATFEAFNVKKYQTNVSTSNYASHLRVAHGVAAEQRQPPILHGKAAASGGKGQLNAKQQATSRTYRKRPNHEQQQQVPSRVEVEQQQQVQRHGLVDDQEAVAGTLHVDQDVRVGGAHQMTTTSTRLSETANASVVSCFTSYKDIVACFVRDLIPFDIAGSAGFQEILHKCGVAISDDLSVSRLKVGLLEVHSHVFRYVRDVVLSSASLGGCVTVSKWSDVTGRYSYTGFTYHFVTEDFRFEHVCLRVVSSLAPLSADNLAQEIQRSLQHFRIEKNKLFVVKDCCDHVTHVACQQLDVSSCRCIGHIINSMLITNGIHSIVELRNLFNKCLLVVSTLNLGAESLMMAIPEHFYHEALIEVGNLEDVLAAENLVDHARTTANRKDGHNPDVQLLSSRWHITLNVLETFLKHRNVIDLLLEQLQNVGDVAFDDDEWRTLESVHDFLATFADAVEILVGNCTNQYPTLNLVLLFRSHLQLQLESCKSDHPLIAHVKSCIKHSFSEFFPVDDCAILAALLDPRLRDLTVVNDYLAAVKKDKSQFLCEAVWKHAIVIGGSENQPLDTNATGVDNGRGGSTIVQLYAPESTAEVNTDVEEGALCSKRAKLSIMELAKQYSGAATDKCDAIGDEIANLLSQPPEAVVDDDILSFWNRRKEDWPILATLARTVFALPATSLRIADMFYKDGLLRSARRCSLSPTLVDKIIFVGENSCYFPK